MVSLYKAYNFDAEVLKGHSAKFHFPSRRTSTCSANRERDWFAERTQCRVSAADPAMCFRKKRIATRNLQWGGGFRDQRTCSCLTALGRKLAVVIGFDHDQVI